MLCCLVGCNGANENINGTTKTENTVYFEPKCPECGHISLTKSLIFVRVKIGKAFGNARMWRDIRYMGYKVN